MGISVNRLASRLPRRFPVGASYVVEGYPGNRGSLRVVARYLVMPGGERINLPTDGVTPAPARTLPARRNPGHKRSAPTQAPIGKKIVGRKGTS
jgi:hypothetical protein